MKTIHKIIIDHKSSYSVTVTEIKSFSDLTIFLNYLKTNKKLSKATHNSYAFRYLSSQEGKSDGGEKGAGNIILHYLQANNLNNIAVAISRYYGGIKLGSGRFKNIKQALVIFFQKTNKY